MEHKIIIFAVDQMSVMNRHGPNAQDPTRPDPTRPGSVMTLSDG